MTAFEKIEDAFHELASLPEHERVARLEAIEEREPEAAATLRSLLDSHTSGETELDRPAELGETGLAASGGALAGAADDVHPTTLVGSQVGAFRVLRYLASGGMCDVFEAEQATPRRRVALKALRASVAMGSTALRRFMHEVETLAQLDHVHIAGVVDGGLWPSDGGAWSAWFAMELIDEPLSILDYAAHFDLDRAQRLELFLPLCDAVHHAHRRGFLHRDLKPANLLGSRRRPDAGIRVIDFGIARSLDFASRDAWATRMGELVGTPLYMSPEQADGDPGRIDVRSDVYALGVVLFELLLGEHPVQVQGRSITELIAELRAGRLRDPRDVDGEISPDLAAILRRATHVEADLRYDSAEQLRADIVRYMADEPVHAHDVSRLRRIVLFARRHRRGFAIATIALLAGLVAVVQIVTLWQRSESALAKYHVEEQRVRDARAELREVKTTLNGVLSGQREGRDAAARVVESSSAEIARTATRGKSRRVVAIAFDRLRVLDPILRGDRASLEALASSYAQVGKLHGSEWFASAEDVVVACDAYGEAVEIRRAMLAAEPDSVRVRQRLIRDLIDYVHCLRKSKRVEEGVFPADEAVAHARALWRLAPEDDKVAAVLLGALWARSDLVIESDRRAAGLADAKEALDLAIDCAAKSTSWGERLAWAEFRYATWCEYSDVPRQLAPKWCRRASDRIVAQLEEAAKAGVPSLDLRQAVQTILGFESDMLRRRGEREEARARALFGMRSFELLRPFEDVTVRETWSRFVVQAVLVEERARERDALLQKLRACWEDVDAVTLRGVFNPVWLAKVILGVDEPGMRSYAKLVREGIRRLESELRDAAESEYGELARDLDRLRALLVPDAPAKKR